MSGSRGFGRGQPLIALVAVFGGWIGGRAATWSPPPLLPAASALQAPMVPVAAAPGAQGYTMDASAGLQSPPGGGDPVMAGGGYGMSPGHGVPSRYDVVPQGYLPMGAMAPPGYALVPIGASPAAHRVVPRGRAAYALQQGAAGGLETLPGTYRSMPAAHVAAEFAETDPGQRFYAPAAPTVAPPAGLPAPAPAATGAKPKRWTADAWALLRRDGAAGAVSPGALPATYGASQAGAVLRYRLALNDPRRPTIYLRSTSTMGLVRETSAAIGVSARPFPTIPVVLAGEGRLTEAAGRRRIQPAVMAITELAPFALPAGFRGEAYAQAGYVGGPFATPFADGQFRVDHGLWRVAQYDLRIGAGIWGGAQKGAYRLDAGPSASIALPLPRGSVGRIAVDWRFRVAGEAHPGPGPAVTLSAGF